MKTIGKYSIPEVLDHIGRYERTYDGYKVKMDSQRYYTFVLSGTECVKCGLQAEFFLLQQGEDGPENRAHFNLYAEQNHELILFTKDHIVPKSKGGSNSLNNYQTMCYPCNIKKGNTLK